MALFVAFLICAAQIAPAAAQTLPGDAAARIDLREPTEAEIKEGLEIYNACTRNQVLRTTFNCECVAVDFLESRIVRGAQADQRTLSIQSRKNCVDTAQVAGTYYKRCLDWAVSLRNDYEQFCSCYGNEYALTFAKDPLRPNAGRENLMTQAMNSCNSMSSVRSRMAQSKLIEDLKTRGVYKRLFPGAEDLSMPQRQAPAPRTTLPIPAQLQ